MNTCKTCKWWAGREEKHSSAGNCFGLFVTDILPGSDQALNSFDIAGRPHLITGPSFGCIHHSPKIPATVRPEEV